MSFASAASFTIGMHKAGGMQAIARSARASMAEYGTPSLAGPSMSPARSEDQWGRVLTAHPSSLNAELPPNDGSGSGKFDLPQVPVLSSSTAASSFTAVQRSQAAGGPVAEGVGAGSTATGTATAVWLLAQRAQSQGGIATLGAKSSTPASLSSSHAASKSSGGQLAAARKLQGGIAPLHLASSSVYGVSWTEGGRSGNMTARASHGSMDDQPGVGMEASHRGGSNSEGEEDPQLAVQARWSAASSPQLPHRSETAPSDTASPRPRIRFVQHFSHDSSGGSSTAGTDVPDSPVPPSYQLFANSAPQLYLGQAGGQESCLFPVAEEQSIHCPPTVVPAADGDRVADARHVGQQRLDGVLQDSRLLEQCQVSTGTWSPFQVYQQDVAWEPGAATGAPTAAPQTAAADGSMTIPSAHSVQRSRRRSARRVSVRDPSGVSLLVRDSLTAPGTIQAPGADWEAAMVGGGGVDSGLLTQSRSMGRMRRVKDGRQLEGLPRLMVRVCLTGGCYVPN